MLNFIILWNDKLTCNDWSIVANKSRISLFILLCVQLASFSAVRSNLRSGYATAEHIIIHVSHLNVLNRIPLTTFTILSRRQKMFFEINAQPSPTKINHNFKKKKLTKRWWTPSCSMKKCCLWSCEKSFTLRTSFSKSQKMTYLSLWYIFIRCWKAA